VFRKTPLIIARPHAKLCTARYWYCNSVCPSVCLSDTMLVLYNTYRQILQPSDSSNILVFL